MFYPTPYPAPNQSNSPLVPNTDLLTSTLKSSLKPQPDL